LIIDPNAVLPGSIPFQLFQPIPRWNPKLPYSFSCVQDEELSQRPLSNRAWEATSPLTSEDSLRICVSKALDHRIK